MTLIDWIILLLYAVSSISAGVYYGRKQKDTREYFIGSGRMNPVMIGISLFATLWSTISFLAIPGEVLGMGPAYLAIYLAYPFVFAVLAFVILPVYMRNRVTSAYELLEQRLGTSVRLLGAVLFLALRLLWMSLLIFLMAKAIATIIGVGQQYVPLIIVVTTLCTLAYTSVGGIRAVVITDVLQTAALCGGTLLVIAVVSWKMGGFGWFPTEWQSAVWDRQPLFSLDPSVRVTVFGSMLWMFLWLCATSMGDQMSVQRFMSTQDLGAARRALATQLVGAFLIGSALGITGLALLGFFQANPELLPHDRSLKAQADLIFPHFIAAHLPPVVTGIVVSGLFAAGMSSISSGVNSISAVVMTDFLDRLRLKPTTERQHVRSARLLALGVGLAVMIVSTFMKHVPGNFLSITNKTANLLAVPIALLFVFALFVPFANARGVWIGTLASILTAVLIAFSGLIFGMDPVTGLDPVSFQWIAPCSLIAGLVVGLPACLIFHKKNS
jgi:solute:Na+ symporter, SSS family